MPYTACDAQLLHGTMPIETTKDAIVRSLSADQEDAVVEHAGATQRAVAKVRQYAWLAFAISREIVAWACEAAWETLSRTRASKRAVTVLMGIVVSVLCVYAGVLAMLYVTQRSLLYFPETIHTTPAAAGLPQAEEVKPVILYLHGNGGALRYRVERFTRLITDGIGIVAVEYRGYGGSSGSPSERGLIADAEAGYAFAAARYSTQQIVVWGESLGSGVAVALAAEKPVGRVILEAPFTSAAAVGAKHYWYMPVRLLMTDQFRSDARIGKVTAPLLILHGAKDQTVPYAMGEHLFDIANKPKHIVRFLDGGHEDLDKNGALIAVGRFLAGDLDP
jgi:pimeloyl-ACP methyl ester carboxylesterase